MKSPNKTRAEAASDALSAAEGLEERALSEKAEAERWQRWIDSWETRNDYPARWHMEELRNRTQERAKKKNLDVRELLGAIDKLIDRAHPPGATAQSA